MTKEMLNEVIFLLQKVVPLVESGEISNLILNEAGMIQIRIPEKKFKELFSEYFIDSRSWDNYDSLYVIRGGIKIHALVKKGENTWE